MVGCALVTEAVKITQTEAIYSAQCPPTVRSHHRVLNVFMMLSFLFCSNFLTLTMSRVEAVAALAPGVFALLICTAAKGIDNTLRPSKRCENSAREVDSLQNLPGI